MTESFDVVVIGGGVIGMTGAWRLAQTGRRVLLLERDRTGAEASSAAAGMLGAQLEVSKPGLSTNSVWKVARSTKPLSTSC